VNAQIATIPQNSTATAAGDSAFALAQRQAKALASSDLVPQQYRNNLPNTLLAMEVANRIGASPFAVMQNLYIVQGRPSWSSSFLIATVNACGRFEPLRFEVVGTEPSKKDYKVRAYAKDKSSGEVCYGAWITWAMVEAEGWSKKNGSKWLTMPEQMFMYRAAGFWARVYAPEISLGILTTEEAKDVWGGPELQPTAPTEHGNLKSLEAALVGAAQPIEGEVVQRDPDAPTAQQVHDSISNAADRDALEEAADLIRSLPDADRPALIALYETRRDSFDLADK